MSITASWRDASRDAHRAIETTPLSRALVMSEIEADVYCRLLVQMQAIHGAWERAMATTDTLGLYDSAMSREDVLVADLRALGHAPGGDAITPATRAFVADIEAMRQECPVALVGVLYVLEGSRMGSMMLGPAIAKALQVPMRPGAGLDYHILGLRDVPARWGAAKARIDVALADHPDAAAAGRAVVRTFSHMHAVYESCMPMIGVAAATHTTATKVH